MQPGTTDIHTAVPLTNQFRHGRRVFRLKRKKTLKVCEGFDLLVWPNGDLLRSSLQALYLATREGKDGIRIPLGGVQLPHHRRAASFFLTKLGNPRYKHTCTVELKRGRQPDNRPGFVLDIAV